MKHETKFPRGFPAVGDVIRFTCSSVSEPKGSVTAEDITGRKHYSTVEAIVVSREYDEATDMFYLTTSNEAHKNIHKEGDEWLSDGFLRAEDRSSEKARRSGLLREEEYRARIHELKVVRRSHT